MDSEDALELTLTWGEAQDLLRPAPNSRPSIVMIDDHEIETRIDYKPAVFSGPLKNLPLVNELTTLASELKKV